MTKKKTDRIVIPDWRTLTPESLEALYVEDPKVYWALTTSHWTDRGFIALKEAAWAIAPLPEPISDPE